DVEMVHGGLGVPQALEHEAEIAVHPRAVGPQRQRQLALLLGQPEELLAVEEVPEVDLTDRASGIGFRRVPPEGFRVPPYLYLIPREGPEGEDPGRRHGRPRAREPGSDDAGRDRPRDAPHRRPHEERPPEAGEVAVP